MNCTLALHGYRTSYNRADFGIGSIVLLGSCGSHAAYSKDLFDHRVDAAIIKWI